MIKFGNKTLVEVNMKEAYYPESVDNPTAIQGVWLELTFDDGTSSSHIVNKSLCQLNLLAEIAEIMQHVPH